MCRFVFSGCIFGLVCFLVLFCRTRRLRFIAIYICCNMVMERLICCDCCCMWIEFQTSGVSCSFEDASDDCFIFLCSKCIRLKDLELSIAACVCCRSLEASGVDVGSQTCDSDVDDSSLGDADSSLGDVDSSLDEVDSSLGEVDSMVSVPSSGSDERSRVGLVNREVCTIDGVEAGISDVRSVDRPKDKVLWIGDSLVRYVDTEFCGVNRSSRIRVCLPGARIDDVSSRVESLCKGEDTVVVSIGTNDIPRRSVEFVRRSFMELLFKLKDTGCKVLVVGLLPRRGRGSMVDKMVLINQWLESVYRLFEFGFVDL